MQHDLQMVRGPVEGGYNLAIGEPVLLQQHLTWPALATPGPFQYPALGGEPELLAELRRMNSGKQVVVANGAKQALAAAFYAYKTTQNKTWVHHWPPYWPSYPTLAKLVGMGFNYGADGTPPLTCLTSPNNPDGKEDSFSCRIWDAAYAHGVYGWNGRVPQHEVAVYSAAKLLGLSGVRVGWLATENEALAKAAEHYVELTTSGVSVPAQRYVAEALRLLRERGTWEPFRYTRDAMALNAQAFNSTITPHCDRVAGVPYDGVGMFAWFRPLEPARFALALAQAKVALVTGEACGQPGWYRMNMCQNRTYTEAALTAIRRSL